MLGRENQNNRSTTNSFFAISEWNTKKKKQQQRWSDEKMARLNTQIDIQLADGRNDSCRKRNEYQVPVYSISGDKKI